MANRTVEKMVVEQLTKYGFKDANGYVSWSKDISESDKAAVVPGARFEADVYTSDKGTRYLNKIVAKTAKVEVPKLLDAVTDVTPPVDQERANKFVPKYEKKAQLDNTMSKADWAAKDRSQLIGGLSHDAAALAAQVIHLDGSLEPGTDSALKAYRILLEGMLKIREELK